jgi:hypothetical protein
MLNVIMLSAIMLNVIMLSAIMLNVIMLSVVMLGVVAPSEYPPSPIDFITIIILDRQQTVLLQRPQ